MQESLGECQSKRNRNACHPWLSSKSAVDRDLGDMAQWLRVCLALTGDGSSNPCTHVGRLQLQGVQGELNPFVSEGTYTRMHRHTCKVHKIKKNIFQKNSWQKCTAIRLQSKSSFGKYFLTF